MKPLSLPDAYALAPSPSCREVASDCSVESYEGVIPAFVDGELKRLYRSIYSCLPQFHIHGGVDNAHVFVVRDDTRVLSTLLYRINGSEVEVMNECASLDPSELSRFADFIFRRHTQIGAIRFRSITASAIDDNSSKIHSTTAPPFKLAYPYQRHQCNEDVVVNLPSSVDQYFSSLGKSTRSYLNRYLNKVKRLHPTFAFQTFEASEIREADVAAIFEMNRARMTKRGVDYGYSEDYPARTYQLARELGMVCTVSIEGKLCAGTVLYCVEGEYFLEVLSHRSEYNDVGLGKLCCYLAICECIRRGGSAFHFLWGRYDYKARLGGKPRPLFNLVVYRSWAHMAARLPAVMKRAGRGRWYQAKQWMKMAAEKDDAVARIANGLAALLRRVRIPHAANR